MRRSIWISEEHGLFRVESSLGQRGAGPSLSRALENFCVYSGVPEDVTTELAAGGWKAGDVFEATVPPREENHDQPASTVR